MEAGNVCVRLHHGGPQGAKPKGEVAAKILADIRERFGYLFTEKYSCMVGELIANR